MNNVAIIETGALRGDTWTIDLLFEEGPESAARPIDISAMVVRLVVLQSESAADDLALILKEVGPGQHSNPACGATRIALSSSDTDRSPGLYFLKVILLGAETRKTYARGTFQVW